MKIIDLLNKIAKGEEVPVKVKYKNHHWKYNERANDYIDEDEDHVFSCSNYDITSMLDEEAEIIEEVEDKEYEDIEEIDILCDILGGDKTEILIENIHDTQEKLNALIRNQKYILERLDK